MKLGWVKYGQYLHTVPVGEWSGAGGTKMRIRLWKNLLNNGFDIDVFSEIGAEHLYAFKALQEEVKGRLRYRIGEKPVGLDALVVECGPQSLIYHGSTLPHDKSPNIPHLVRANSVISQYEGLVLYFQHDLELGFCFTLESLAPSFFIRGYDKLYGNSASLTKNKTWVVITQPYRPKRFIELYSDTRSPYEALNIPAETFTIATLAIPKEPILPRRNPKSSLVYCGNWRKRMNYPSIADLAFYLNQAPRHSAVYGEWPYEVKKLIGKIEFRGAAPAGYQAKFMNRGAFGILIGGKKICETDTLSGRYYEHLSGGAVMLLEERFRHLIGQHGSYFPRIPEELLVSGDTAQQKMLELYELSYAERSKLWERQWTGISHLRDTRQFSQRLTYIIEKYQGRDLGQHKKHLDYTERYLGTLEHGAPQDKAKARFHRGGWKDVLYYPRLCRKCGHEVILRLGQKGMPATSCTECGGPFARLRRFPRPITPRFPRLKITRFPREKLNG
jgi:hypothetical protein